MRSPLDSRSNPLRFQTIGPAIAGPSPATSAKNRMSGSSPAADFARRWGRENRAKCPILPNLGAFGSVPRPFSAPRAGLVGAHSAPICDLPPSAARHHATACRHCHDLAMTPATSFRAPPLSRRLIAGASPTSQAGRLFKTSVALNVILLLASGPGCRAGNHAHPFHGRWPPVGS